MWPSASYPGGTHRRPAFGLNARTVALNAIPMSLSKGTGRELIGRAASGRHAVGETSSETEM